jgi:pyruvate,water dikinase
MVASAGLGCASESITEPLTIMLWGITQETIQQWLGGDTAEDGVLRASQHLRVR